MSHSVNQTNNANIGTFVSCSLSNKDATSIVNVVYEDTK